MPKGGQCFIETSTVRRCEANKRAFDNEVMRLDETRPQFAINGRHLKFLAEPTYRHDPYRPAA